MEEEQQFEESLSLPMGINPNRMPMGMGGDKISPQEEILPPAPRMRNEPMEDPFMDSQFNNMPMPDVPLQGSNGMVDVILSDEEAPKEIRKKYWHVFHRDNTLTFLDEPRKQSKLLSFYIFKIDAINTMGYYDYDFDTELEFGVMRNIFETKLDRALGFKGNIKNERVMLNSQFTESRQISEHGQGNQVKEGFFKRLLGRR